MNLRALFTFTSAVALSACSYQAKGRVVSMSQLGDPNATRIFNFMNTAGGTEETRADHLIDEAVIASFQPGEVCFALTIRSTLHADLHPSQWKVALNGVAGTVEEVAPKDTETWDTTYTSEEVVMRKTTRRGETTYSAPVERTGTGGYTVRHARACAPLQQGVGKLRLKVELAHPFGDEDWGQVYEWTLRG